MKNILIILVVVCGGIISCQSPKLENNTEVLSLKTIGCPELYNPNLDSLFKVATTQTAKIAIWLYVKAEGQKKCHAIEDSALGYWLRTREKALDVFKTEEPSTYAYYSSLKVGSEEFYTFTDTVKSESYHKYDSIQTAVWRTTRKLRDKARMHTDSIQYTAWQMANN